jgi:hypothetical protein
VFVLAAVAKVGGAMDEGAGINGAVLTVLTVVSVKLDRAGGVL